MFYTLRVYLELVIITVFPKLFVSTQKVLPSQFNRITLKY